jgi:hypothetical protein
MVVLEDFTRTQAGADIPAEGPASCCPSCGRAGIEQSSEKGPIFVHSQLSEILGDGMRTEPQDCCTLPSPALR